MSTKLTVSDIRRISLKKGCFFFRRNTMEFWKESIKDYKVKYIDNKPILVRTTDNMQWNFDIETGALRIRPIDVGEKYAQRKGERL